VLQRNTDVRRKVTDFLEVDYQGEGRVLHFLELLRDDYGFAKLAKKVSAPLQGHKLAAYYGCLLLRPARVMQFDDPENPSIMEELIRALGAEPVETPYRTECCGAYLSVTEEKVASANVGKIAAAARRAGADAIITACPLCRYNLEQFAPESGGALPVYYFSELLAEALGIKAGLASGEVGQG
jgi:heterodisulfide reductase subunit B2